MHSGCAPGTSALILARRNPGCRPGFRTRQRAFGTTSSNAWEMRQWSCSPNTGRPSSNAPRAFWSAAIPWAERWSAKSPRSPAIAGMTACRASHACPLRSRPKPGRSASRTIKSRLRGLSPGG